MVRLKSKGAISNLYFNLNIIYYTHVNSVTIIGNGSNLVIRYVK